MQKPMGCLEITGHGAGARTRDLVICGHCQRAIEVKPGGPTVVADAGQPDLAWCPTCGGMVCAPCKAAAAKLGKCVTFVARVHQQMEAEAMRRQTAKALGLEGR